MESILQLGYILINRISNVYLLVVDKNESKIVLENSDGLVHEFDEQYVATSEHLELVCDNVTETFDDRRLTLKKFESIKQIPGIPKDGDSKQNPKYIQALKDGKVPLEYLPYSCFADDAKCHKHGADKYGVRNWQLSEILSSTYEGAILRHFSAWAMGEDIDPDSGVSHLTHIRACCAVLLDSERVGTLIDDRNRKEEKKPE